MDRLSKKQRSALMSRVRSVSAMEKRARALATKRAGVQLRHQPKGVPGRPDYANKSRKVAVFVHGCFWHSCPSHGTLPASNRAFWRGKFARNAERHGEAVRALRKGGWRVVTVWEHDVPGAR